MANPQPDKFTPIHNEVLEALVKKRLSTYEWQVLLCIIRKTYGYVEESGHRKKMDWITSSQISDMTDIARPHVSRAIGKLAKKGFLKKEGIKIGLSKDFYKLPKQVIMNIPEITQAGNSKLPNQVIRGVPKQVQGCTQTGTESVPKQVHTKERKKILQKKYIETIISYLNQKTGKNYSPKSEALLKGLCARLEEGHTVAECKAVIDIQTAEWKGTDMEKYLTPDTLFRPSKFPKYLANVKDLKSEEEKNKEFDEKVKRLTENKK